MISPASSLFVVIFMRAWITSGPAGSFILWAVDESEITCLFCGNMRTVGTWSHLALAWGGTEFEVI